MSKRAKTSVEHYSAQEKQSQMNKSSKLLLSSDEEESDKEEESEFRINKKFASAYEKRKQKQELAAHKDYDDESGSDDNDSSEDEDGKLLTTDLDVNIMKALNAIRNKEQHVYDPSTKFFDDETEKETSSSDDEVQKKTKPKRYKDVVREEILEKMRKEEEDDQEDDSHHSEEGEDNGDDQRFRYAYDDEQKAIRKAFLDSAKDESDDEGLLVIKSNDRQQMNPESEKKLKEEIAKLEATIGEKSDLVDPRGEVENGESFLLNYFKKRAWLDSERDGSGSNSDDDDHSDGEIPMKSAALRSEDDDASLDELDQADDFEAQYNFRFEEAASRIQSGAELSNISYARGQTMNTLRRKDESRREKRLARQERKALERQAKEEQLRRLKNAKRQEMEEKIKQIKTVLGDLDEGAVDEATLLQLLEGDFDPDKFESLMKETYGDDFYQKQDSQWKSDFDVRESLKTDEDGALLVGQDDAEGGLYDVGDEDEGNDVETESSNNEEGDREEDWPDDMEEEPYEDNARDETELERKVKSRMMDELYKLDYEDIIADMPTRFKYKQVKANNFGLSTEEILFCRDSTLKQFVSLKKLAPYKEDGEYVVNSRKRRRFREMARREIDELLQQEAGVDQEYVEENKKGETDQQQKKRRRKRSKKVEDETKQVPTESAKSAPNANIDVPKSKRRRKKKLNSAIESDGAHDIKNDKDGTIRENATTENSKGAEHESADDGQTKSTSKNVKKEKKGSNKDKAAKPDVKKEKKAKKKKANKSKNEKKPKVIDGVSQSRLASFGL
ncbi:protein KRI1 [Fistulifera solaris]|uniref:Protein KRI1 n=1 Tax=Fistulifera solaris TaxID=1519565 RepID=A0A1Z5KJ48_FISSO|nr:protein KRI1 [Fistulifera solaris]|eukprot:GAX26299.1 protein KRI1 [Fistulifera solaris]